MGQRSPIFQEAHMRRVLGTELTVGRNEEEERSALDGGNQALADEEEMKVG